MLRCLRSSSEAGQQCPPAWGCWALGASCFSAPRPGWAAAGLGLFVVSPAERAVASVASAGTELASSLLFVSGSGLVCCPRCCHVMARKQHHTQALCLLLKARLWDAAELYCRGGFCECAAFGFFQM